MLRWVLLLTSVLASLASAVPEDVYFGVGCFWHIQHEFVGAERDIVGRNNSELTSQAGYAGGKTSGEEDRVCYHNSEQIADYGELGHGEVVGVTLPSDKIVEFSKVYFSLFDKATKDRVDPMDRGGEYRSMIGLAGGKSHPSYPDIEIVAQEAGFTLEIGNGNEGDTLGKQIVWVYDTSAFPFYQAEVYHQFHDDFRTPAYGKDYNNIAKLALADGRLKHTGCPRDTAPRSKIAQEDVYFGVGCFWHIQHEFVGAEKDIIGRDDTELTSKAGYAGGRTSDEQGRVCYHNSQSIADYGKLGHGEVVGVTLPSDKIVDFSEIYFSLFDKNTKDRVDPMDRGGEYRSMIGLAGGNNHPLYLAIEAVAQEAGFSLEVGNGNDGDTLGKQIVWVYDTSSFPFYQAEVYHQFHDDFRTPAYGKDYNNIAKLALADGRLKHTGCSGNLFLPYFQLGALMVCLLGCCSCFVGRNERKSHYLPVTERGQDMEVTAQTNGDSEEQ